MDKNLEKIEQFIEEHHVLSLATTGKELSVCSLFYTYDKESHSFIVASSKDTLHIQNIQISSDVAGNILLETKEVGKIQGLQFGGICHAVSEKRLKLLYFKHFPYALALTPKLWQIRVNFFKLTDNRLGFGKKLIWQDSSV